MVGHKQLISLVHCSLFFSILMSMLLLMPVQAVAPAVGVNPSSLTVEVEQNFSVNITISDVFDLYGWEFTLNWNPDLLKTVSEIEGTFLKSDGQSTFFTYNISSIDGRMVVDCTRLGWVSGVNGNGTLATLTFFSKDYGGCALDLYDVALIDSNVQPIVCQTSDGLVWILTLAHDLTVTDVLPIKQVVGRGYNMIIDVTVLNYGAFDEVANVSTYVNSTVQTQNLSIQSAEAVVLTFLFDTTGIDYGTYSTSAYVWPVPSETDTSDNNFTCAISVYVGVPGDVNADGRVDMKDIASVAIRFYASAGESLYNPNYDIIWDGRIDMKDIALAAKNFGETET
jgi:hypothetical protein